MASSYYTNFNARPAGRQAAAGGPRDVITRADLTAATGDISALETDVAALETDLTAAEADIADHETRIAALEA